MNEVFLDTETTGLSFKEGHKIVEIACIETKDLISTGNTFHRFIIITLHHYRQPILVVPSQ